MIATALPNQNHSDMKSTPPASPLSAVNEKQQGAMNLHTDDGDGDSISSRGGKKQQQQRSDRSQPVVRKQQQPQKRKESGDFVDDGEETCAVVTSAMNDASMLQSDAGDEADKLSEMEESSSVGADPDQNQLQERVGNLARNNSVEWSCIGTSISNACISNNKPAANSLLMKNQQQKLRIIYDAAQSVLAEIRRDPRYVHPSRFNEELTVTEVYGHSLHLSFQQLLPQLSNCSTIDATAAVAATCTNIWLHPFCEALTQRDNSAAVATKVARILAQFLEYGPLVVDDARSLLEIANAVTLCPWIQVTAPAATDEKTTDTSHRRQSVKNIYPSNAEHGSGGVVEATATALTLGRRRSLAIPRSTAPATQANHYHDQPSTTSCAIAVDQNNSYFPSNINTEVVLQVLHVAVLTFRTACTQKFSPWLLNDECLMKLFETCWRVVPSTLSSLIRSSAHRACQQMVIAVFQQSSNNEPCSRSIRKLILRWLADLLPSLGCESEFLKKHHRFSYREKKQSATASDAASTHGGPCNANADAKKRMLETPTIGALTLLSTALDCIVDVSADNEQALLETLTKHVLVLAILTAGETTLQVCSRVFFQLLDRMPHQLKCEAELLLQNVHLRRLKESDASTPEITEAVLESLLELCYGGLRSLQLTDLYLNYDCDMRCTNLFEAVLVELSKKACPDGWNVTSDCFLEEQPSTSIDMNVGDAYDGESTAAAQPSNNATAFDGSGNGKTPLPTSSNSSTVTDLTLKPNTSSAVTASSNISNKPLPIVSTHAPLNHLNRLALEGILSVLDSIAIRSTSTGFVSFKPDPTAAIEGNMIAITEDELFARKQKKIAMAKVVNAFNTENPDKEGFLKIAVAEGLLETTSDGAKAAELLYNAPDSIDKRKLGTFLSRGPESNYPFQASVRKHFAKCYDFSGLTFAAALRRFLSKFHLPGEAQLIDRLMEVFSKEVYRQHRADEGESCVFKNADAAYVLAFSTIMLNTDLHNPTIKADRRMTQEQFVKNNRGINGGDDLPACFLMELYDEIKNRQLQVRRDAGDFMKKQQKEDLRCAWDGISERKKEIAAPVVLASSKSDRGYVGLLDKEMFLILVKSSLPAISGVFVRSYDDALVVRTLRGLQQIVKVAAHFEFDNIVNDVLQILLPQARDFVLQCATYDQQQISNGMDMDASVGTNDHRTSSTDSLFEEETTFEDENCQRIPFGLLCSSDEKGQVEISGSASNRGLLALDSSFLLLRKYSGGVKDAWPAFFDCLCAMRDCRALPAGLSELDDFADSHGNVLPLSSFAKASKKRLDDHHRSLSDTSANQQKGWFRSFFRKSHSGETQESTEDIACAGSTHPKGIYSKTLLGVANAADIESIVELGSLQVPDKTVRDLLDKLDSFPFTNDPVGEQHAVFSLELAARTLLLNRERVVDLFLLFLTKFEKILCKATEAKDETVAAPFVVERIVVTILRSSIHLYELDELRPHLCASLQLLMMTLPRTFIRAIADRMACGLAIILRASFHFFDSQEWSFMGDTLDVLANYSSSRVFVLDGIASTVEFSLPNIERDRHHDLSAEGGDRPKLSKEACVALSRILTRFVLGFYQNDSTLTVPAMLCLEKVYRHKVVLLLEEQMSTDGIDMPSLDPVSMVPDKEFWQNIAVALYSVCRSSESESSSEGLECYRRVILRTAVDQVPEEKWIAVMYLMAHKQPPLAAEVSRGNTFSVLGHLLIRVLPHISHNQDYREDLEDLIIQYASLAEENLRHSRRGKLFDKTLQTLTYITNRMVSDDWNGEQAFSAWANETLLKELDRTGKGAQVVNTALQSEDVSEMSDSVAESDVEEIMGSR